MRVILLAAAVVLAIGTFAPAQTPTPIPEDINRDGIVDHEDLMSLQAGWHTGVEPAATETPVPTSTPTNTPGATATPGDSDELPVDLPELPGDAEPLVLVRIPAGVFLMGSSDSWATSMEQPVHEVTIGSDFYIGKHEITQAQWVAVMGNNPSQFSGDDKPVEKVSWGDCQAFVDALNQLGQGTFRLPSEAEWEYACRGSAFNPNRYARYYFGDSDCAQVGTAACDLDAYAWWSSTSLPPQYGTKEVGQLIPNDLGLYDMHGNVFEWCEDHWHAGYEGAPDDGSAWLSPPSPDRVIRGGTWHLDAPFSRSGYRRLGSPTERQFGVGFRIVREP